VEKRPTSGDFSKTHQERLTIGAGGCPEAAIWGWELPAEEVMAMLAIELIALLSTALALLTGAMVAAQLSRGRLVNPDTLRRTSRRES